ncbi:MAG: hypothetical protein KHY54_12650, partial [Roseburia sp.]|nr:hypothetical protein [Roseburia sp.]
LLFSSIINYTKKSLRPHGLGDFSVRGVFLQPLFILRNSVNKPDNFKKTLMSFQNNVCYHK